MPQLNIVDMFCGGGGESTGLMQAANKFGYDVKLSKKQEELPDLFLEEDLKQE